VTPQAWLVAAAVTVGLVVYAAAVARTVRRHAARPRLYVVHGKAS
jgi:hypothetical protein